MSSAPPASVSKRRPRASTSRPGGTTYVVFSPSSKTDPVTALGLRVRRTRRLRSGNHKREAAHHVTTGIEPALVGTRHVMRACPSGGRWVKKIEAVEGVRRSAAMCGWPPPGKRKCSVPHRTCVRPVHAVRRDCAASRASELHAWVTILALALPSACRRRHALILPHSARWHVLHHKVSFDPLPCWPIFGNDCVKSKAIVHGSPHHRSIKG